MARIRQTTKLRAQRSMISAVGTAGNTLVHTANGVLLDQRSLVAGIAERQVNTLSAAFTSQRSTVSGVSERQIRSSSAALAAQVSRVAGGSAGSSALFGRVFFDDFENRATVLASGNPGWQQDPGGHALMTIASTGPSGQTPQGGSKMLLGNHNGTLAWNDPNRYQTLYLPLNKLPMTSEMLFRFYIRIDPSYTDSVNWKVIRWGYGSYTGEGNDEDGGVFKIEGNNYYVIPREYHVNWPSAGQQPDTMTQDSLPGTLTAWTKVEIYWKKHATAGDYKIWVNDTLAYSRTNAKTTWGGNFGPLYIMSNWSPNGFGPEPGATNYSMFDGIEFYSDAGTGGTGSMSDGTAGVA